LRQLPQEPARVQPLPQNPGSLALVVRARHKLTYRQGAYQRVQ